MADNTRALFCLLEDEFEERSSVFRVCVSINDYVTDLQEAIKKEKQNDLRPYDADSLILWRVSRR